MAELPKTSADLLVNVDAAMPFQISSDIRGHLPPANPGIRWFVWERAKTLPPSPLLGLYNKPRGTLSQV